jgi:putative ABC transport system permease protein
MNIWKISIKNLKSKSFYTFLSIITLALSITLLLGIQQLKTSFEYQMENNLGDIDLVVGAKGSPLQLILASVLHIDNPTGNISYNEAEKLTKNPMVKLAVPISYGDNYKGYRIVGSTASFYTLYDVKLAKGKYTKTAMEVVIGATVANQLNLKIGDTFTSSHGLTENTIELHDEKLKVVGILKPTQKVIDRLIVTNLETVWDVHNHEEQHEEKNHIEDKHLHNTAHEHEAHESHKHHEKEITSLLITFKSPMALLTFPRKINEGSNMQAAIPKLELDRLYEFTNVGFTTITWVAYLILVISGITIFINLFKMVKERAFDLALLRTYGATNFQIIKMVFYEGLSIAVIAFSLGLMSVKLGLYLVLNYTDLGSKYTMLNDLELQNILQIGVLEFTAVIVSIFLAIYPVLTMNISTILRNEK